jgi:hypothetical protein
VFTMRRGGIQGVVVVVVDDVVALCIAHHACLDLCAWCDGLPLHCLLCEQNILGSDGYLMDFGDVKAVRTLWSLVALCCVVLCCVGKEI